MNKVRRKLILLIVKRLNKLICDTTEDRINITMQELESVISDLQDVLDEESDCMYNTPENLQGSERYKLSEEACDYMEDVIDELAGLCVDDDLDDIKTCIEESVEQLYNIV